MKRWLEYINTQAAELGLEVGRLVLECGQFATFRVAGVPSPLAYEGYDLPTVGQPGDFQTREEVEAFLLGVTFGRTGAL